MSRFLLQILCVFLAIISGALFIAGTVFMIVGIVNWSIYAKKKKESAAIFFSDKSFGVAFNF